MGNAVGAEIRGTGDFAFQTMQPKPDLSEAIVPRYGTLLIVCIEEEQIPTIVTG